MSFKFLKISSYYRDFLHNYYEKKPQIKTKGYAEQHKHLMEQYFAWSDNYGRLLAKKGLETMEVVANATYMQKAWATEMNLPETLSAQEIVVKQIENFQPNVIYFQDSITFNGKFISLLKQQFPFIKLCIGNLCAPFTSLQVTDFKEFDYFTVCSTFFQQQFKKYGIESVLIPHAFDGRILNKIDTENEFPTSPFIFTGSIFPDEGFHSIRLNVLEKLVSEKIPFAFYGNLPDNSSLGLMKRRASYMAAKTLDNIGLSSVTERFALIRKGRNHEVMPRNLKISKTLYKTAQPPIFGLDMFKALSKAQIGFNIHGDCSGDYAANMRLYETTGAGSCLLTDSKSDLHNYFKPDVEVVTYASADECVEKVKWLLNNPDKCKAIAQAGQNRTLKEHNFENRVEVFYKYLVKRLQHNR